MRLEREMTKTSGRIDKIHAQMLEAATDGDALVGLGRDLAGAEAELAQLEERWLEAAEAVE